MWKNPTQLQVHGTPIKEHSEFVSWLHARGEDDTCHALTMGMSDHGRLSLIFYGPQIVFTTCGTRNALYLSENVFGFRVLRYSIRIAASRFPECIWNSLVQVSYMP